MHKNHIIFPIITCLLINVANAAESNMRAGLWEISTTSDLLLLAPHLPPDQMQSIKDLAEDYGFEIPKIENGAAISQVCITQEMVNNNTLPNFHQPQLGCTSKNESRSGNQYKIDYVCASSNLKGSGTAAVIITSPKTFTGQTNFSGEAQGNPVNEHADIDGKWINASCGAVKPL